MDVTSLPRAAIRPQPAEPTTTTTTTTAARKLEASQLKTTDPASESNSDEPLREAFQDFVGQTLFGSLLASMRKTVGKPAYLHGGRTEEVFQKQLDQHIVQDLTDASADTLADPMYELFNMQRRS